MPVLGYRPKLKNAAQKTAKTPGPDLTDTQMTCCLMDASCMMSPGLDLVPTRDEVDSCWTNTSLSSCPAAPV